MMKGAVIECYDYTPFGRLISASSNPQNDKNGRYAAGCFPADPFMQPNGKLSHRFTGKERDGESGLDFFGARYFSGVQGRFTSTDPFNPVDELIGQQFDDYLANPQYWNKYAYSLNNPLKCKDSDGHLPHAVVGGLDWWGHRWRFGTTVPASVTGSGFFPLYVPLGGDGGRQEEVDDEGRFTG